MVATGVSSTTFAPPAALTNNTTYFWQVTAKNAGGSTAGPVSSFTTVVAAPSTPTATTPSNGASNVAINTALAWTANGATSYDVAFGTTNPPAMVATGVNSTTFAPPAALTNNTTYFWQVTAKNAGGSTAGPVSSFTTVVAAPSTPTATTPSTGASNVAINTSLAWTANGATSYDVAFGTTNPPAMVATGVNSTTFLPPAALTNNTTYFWQVTANNAGGSTAGPVSSFTTVVAAPSTPTATTPSNGASNVAINTALAWTANGATSYDVAFGTTNPPAVVATGVNSTTFLPPAALTNNTTYFWQVTANNAGGMTTSFVWSFTTLAAPTVPTTIVRYAADATVHGNWSVGTDATAATGRALVSADRGWANTTAALASPSDYFEVTFTAPAATPYHIWLRMKAGGNAKVNDSVFAQFSDARDSNGSAIYGIGTTDSIVINLSTADGDASLSGWGWQDGLYWLAQTTVVTFAGRARTRCGSRRARTGCRLIRSSSVRRPISRRRLARSTATPPSSARTAQRFRRPRRRRRPRSRRLHHHLPLRRRSIRQSPIPRSRIGIRIRSRRSPHSVRPGSRSMTRRSARRWRASPTATHARDCSTARSASHRTRI